jgi:CelD/BcsL family acetyltransferase involved in cellulose biosynthesis
VTNTEEGKREPFMEDLNAAIVAAFNVLESKGLIDTDDPRWDPLWDRLQEVLEKHFDYPDYGGYN